MNWCLLKNRRLDPHHGLDQAIHAAFRTDPSELDKLTNPHRGAQSQGK